MSASLGLPRARSACVVSSSTSATSSPVGEGGASCSIHSEMMYSEKMEAGGKCDKRSGN
uniref:Predicted protein n=1 Tax=Hordeum vulgare subsp. vulgare TaxID=112509 RepID=F2D0F2_HORVV|nr:predicted protein [Hordeum vulgare subsp. vulgare]BAJ89472.1 predicted protein [Hordeum vulgare subsp. vulgare]BAJ91533.1 predicted protein [Hordeum vulgare subsp. vulgare]